MDISAILSRIDSKMTEPTYEDRTKYVGFRLLTEQAKQLEAFAKENNIKYSDLYREIIYAFTEQLKTNK